jgi:hypothetical protein
VESTARIGKARQLLQQGHEKAAARELTEAVHTAHDPAEIDQIRSLAEEGLGHAGMLGKGRWREIIRLAELRREKVGA